MKEKDIEQLFAVKSIKTSVLLWELLSREPINTVLLNLGQEKRLLHRNSDGTWSQKSLSEGERALI